MQSGILFHGYVPNFDRLLDVHRPRHLVGDVSGLRRQYERHFGDETHMFMKTDPWPVTGRSNATRLVRVVYVVNSDLHRCRPHRTIWEVLGAEVPSDACDDSTAVQWQLVLANKVIEAYDARERAEIAAKIVRYKWPVLTPALDGGVDMYWAARSEHNVLPIELAQSVLSRELASRAA